MPCAGEEPITSFFRRITPGSKYKENPRPVRSAAKRKRPSVETEVNQPLSKRSKNRQQSILHDAPQNIVTAPQGTTRPCRTDSPPRISPATPPATELFRQSNPSTIDSRVLSNTLSKSTKTLNERSTQGVSILRKLCLPSPVTVERPGRVASGCSSQPSSPGNSQEYEVSKASSKESCIFTSPPHNSMSYTNAAPLITPVTMPRCTSLRPSKVTIERFSIAPTTGYPGATVGGPSSATNALTSHRPEPLLAAKHAHFETRKIQIPDAQGVVVNHEDPFAPSQSQILVPSSQTQDVDVIHLHHHSFSLGASSSSRRISYLPDDVSDELVDSSQSQHILPCYFSPRRRSHIKEGSHSASQLLDNVPAHLADEVIESSQSQTERELNISTDISSYLPEVRNVVIATSFRLDDKVGDNTYLPGLKHPKSPVKANKHSLSSNESQRPVVRTSSEELFPVSIHNLKFDDIFRDDTPQERSSVLCETALSSKLIDQYAEDSTTEDESEDESANIFSGMRGKAVMKNARTQSSPPPLLPATDTGDVESTDSQSSLPDAMKDFRDMFGEGLGSYPDDFPMSLR